jgi:RimJ/RimL family protein N-acetyltransferase
MDFGFGQLNLKVIYLVVVLFNTRATAVYERMGFVNEGLLRQRVYRDGAYYDEQSMSILKTEWEARSAGSA